MPAPQDPEQDPGEHPEADGGEGEGEKPAEDTVCVFQLNLLGYQCNGIWHEIYIHILSYVHITIRREDCIARYELHNNSLLYVGRRE